MTAADAAWPWLVQEQYNPSYPAQVASMEAKAKELGQGGKLFYMNPNNAKWLHPDDAAKVEAIGIKDVRPECVLTCCGAFASLTAQSRVPACGDGHSSRWRWRR